MSVIEEITHLPYIGMWKTPIYSLIINIHSHHHHHQMPHGNPRMSIESNIHFPNIKLEKVPLSAIIFLQN